MAFVISSICDGVCDTACASVCPVDCIHGPFSPSELEEKKGRGESLATIQLYIEPDECICCAACVPECPVDAIFDEDELPPEHEADRERNARFFERRASAGV